MAEEKHMGWGWSGTKGRPQLQKDLIAMKDRAKDVRLLKVKAVEMEKRAKEVERSGTGNVKAAATYRRTAKLYLERAASRAKGR